MGVVHLLGYPTTSPSYGGTPRAKLTCWPCGTLVRHPYLVTLGPCKRYHIEEPQQQHVMLCMQYPSPIAQIEIQIPAICLSSLQKVNQSSLETTCALICLSTHQCMHQISNALSNVNNVSFVLGPVLACAVLCCAVDALSL